MPNRSESKLLQVWIGGELDGKVKLPPNSVAIHAILKFIDPAKDAELRDPHEHRTYRYDPEVDRGKEATH